jgi:hypothetical protein
MDNWRRAVVFALTAIFAVSLLGGLIANVAGGTGTLTPARTTAHSSSRAAVRNDARAPAGSAQGAAALLKLSDLPAGWAQNPGSTASSKTAAWSEQLASCVGVPAGVAKATPTKVSGPSFTSADRTLGVEDAVLVFPNDAQARAQFSAMNRSKTPGCMNRLGATALASTIQSEAGSGASVGAVSIAALGSTIVGPNKMHETGFTVTIPLTAGGRTLTITSTEINFVEGHVDQQITFNGNGVAFPPALEQQLVLSALGRAPGHRNAPVWNATTHHSATTKHTH